MAGAGLLALLDDITAVLDDVSLMTKVAAQKTAGVLGDDLALNAQQVSGVNADRELPVVWAVAKGSALNKAILVPAALIISSVAPWAVDILLIAGGIYLCYEGVEKLAHKWLHRTDDYGAPVRVLTRATTQLDARTLETQKVKAAIRTDFVLSAEIVTITLGTVEESPLATRIIVLSAVSALMTVGVYGLVAGIVRLDDLGRLLLRRPGEAFNSRFARATGAVILKGAPYLMRTLTVVGTAAMFLVGGGILLHGIPGAHQFFENYFLDPAAALPVVGGLGRVIARSLANATVGILAGALSLFVARLIAAVAALRRA
jgi:predicted DNA repair protein MutK